MAGAEGERSFDLDADAARRDARARMRPMHDETAGVDRREAFKALAHPIGGRERLEHQRIRRGRAGRRRDQRPHRRLVRPLAKMEGQRPASIRLLERRRGHLLASEAFGDGVTHASRRGGVGGEPRERGSDRRRRREHGSILLSRPRTYPTRAGVPIPPVRPQETDPRPPVISRPIHKLRGSFCTDLSRVLRPRGAAGKAVDSPPKQYKTMDGTPMMRSSFAVHACV
jgi:hypothetical protein